MRLTFGKYKGYEVKDCPSTYLQWLINPILPNNNLFQVAKEIKEEAKALYDKKFKEEHYLEWRLNGYTGEKTEYIIERLGDLQPILSIHNTLEEALIQLDKEFPYEEVKEEDEYTDRKIGEKYRRTPDPEDDRILIWEVLPSGHKKVVWHFSGWHWDAEEFPNLDQGKLIGDKESLYSLAMEDM